MDVLQPLSANKENGNPSPMGVPVAKKVRKRRKSLAAAPNAGGQDQADSHLRSQRTAYILR